VQVLTIARTEVMHDHAFAWLLDIALNAVTVAGGQFPLDHWAGSMRRWTSAPPSIRAALTRTAK
jgi:hypothetical protein